MLKRIICSLAVVCAALFFAGCSTCDVATTFNGVKLTNNDADVAVGHITGKIWGIYLVHALPLFSGSSSTPGTCAIGKNTVQADNAVNMVTRRAAQIGASRITDLQTEYTSCPLLFLLSFRSIDVSATALK